MLEGVREAGNHPGWGGNRMCKQEATQDLSSVLTSCVTSDAACHFPASVVCKINRTTLPPSFTSQR